MPYVKTKFDILSLKFASHWSSFNFTQAERNTIPRYDTNPVEERNSVYCQEPPKFPQLAGIVQAQNPANNPNVFFDPKVKTNSSSVLLGSQPNTLPFGR